MFQKFSGRPEPGFPAHGEKFAPPMTLHRYEVVLTSDRAMLPACPVCNWVTNAVQPLAVELLPNAAVMIGSAFCPASPLLNAVLPLPLAMLIARLFWASRNSFRKPFSKMLISF